MKMKWKWRKRGDLGKTRKENRMKAEENKSERKDKGNLKSQMGEKKDKLTNGLGPGHPLTTRLVTPLLLTAKSCFGDMISYEVSVHLYLSNSILSCSIITSSLILESNSIFVSFS